MRGNFAYQENLDNETAVIRNAGNNYEDSQPKLSLTFVLISLVVLILWDFIVLKFKKVGDVVDSKNIRTNAYNIVFISFAAAIGINLFKILFVKLAAWNIPVISWVSKQLIPIFQL